MKMVVTVIGMIPLIFIACLLQSLGMSTMKNINVVKYKSRSLY
jgi:hypothetical protein